MSPQRRLQSGASAVQEPIGTQDSPYLTSEECAAYLRFPSLRAFYRFIEAGRGRTLPRVQRGQRMLFDRRVIDLWLREPGRTQQAVARRLSRVHTVEQCAGER